MNMQATLLFPGSFDPIHLGHLTMLKRAIEKLDPAGTWLLPTGHPVHKNQTFASAEDRIQMIKCATQPFSNIHICEAETGSPNSGYTVDTLTKLKQKYPDRRWFFLIGSDAFYELNQWKNWKILLDMANWIVYTRSGNMPTPITQSLNAQIELRRVESMQALKTYSSGKILSFFDPIPNWASSTIRAMIVSQDQSVTHMLPAPVWTYIQEHTLYVKEQ